MAVISLDLSAVATWPRAMPSSLAQALTIWRGPRLWPASCEPQQVLPSIETRRLPLPSSAASVAQNVTAERPIQTSGGAMDTRRAVVTALAATLALLGLFLLARQLRGTGPHAAAAPAVAPSTVDTTDTAARTKTP